MKSGWFDRSYHLSTTLTGMNLYSQGLILQLIASCFSFSTRLPRINVRLIGHSCPSHLTCSLRCLLVQCVLPPNNILLLFRIRSRAPRGAAAGSSLNLFLPKSPFFGVCGQAAAGPLGSTQHRPHGVHSLPTPHPPLLLSHLSLVRQTPDVSLLVSLHSHHLLHRFQLLDATFPSFSLQ